MVASTRQYPTSQYFMEGLNASPESHQWQGRGRQEPQLKVHLTATVCTYLLVRDHRQRGLDGGCSCGDGNRTL